MTKERASEIVAALVGEEKYDLFDFFLKYFYGGKPSRNDVLEFSDLCGIAFTVKAKR